MLAGFATMDGHDRGVCRLLPFGGRGDDARRGVINTIAARWEGNPGWLIAAGGILFAVWPLVHATAFSGIFAAMPAKALRAEDMVSDWMMPTS